jgi:hypothetical protein
LAGAIAVADWNIALQCVSWQTGAGFHHEDTKSTKTKRGSLRPKTAFSIKIQGYGIRKAISRARR